MLIANRLTFVQSFRKIRHGLIRKTDFFIFLEVISCTIICVAIFSRALLVHVECCVYSRFIILYLIWSINKNRLFMANIFSIYLVMCGLYNRHPYTYYLQSDTTVLKQLFSHLDAILDTYITHVFHTSLAKVLILSLLNLDTIFLQRYVLVM